MKINTFFKKIYIINLFDKTERWKKVSNQFKRRGIKVERFIAIDGRCSSQGVEACRQKLKNFEMVYNVKIPVKKNSKLNVVVPAASLTIGTILILRDMVKNKYPYILICEDDIDLQPNFEKRFIEGMKELKGKTWDVLYLGCGDACGNIGVSYRKNRRTGIPSQLNKVMGTDIYVSSRNDLRTPCEDECPMVSKSISRASHPTGTWCYGYSLAGARKMLRLIDNNAGNHIDQILASNVQSGKLKAYSFDPPIVMHESITAGPGGKRNTDIPWEW